LAKASLYLLKFCVSSGATKGAAWLARCSDVFAFSPLYAVSVALMVCWPWYSDFGLDGYFPYTGQAPIMFSCPMAFFMPNGPVLYEHSIPFGVFYVLGVPYV